MAEDDTAVEAMAAPPTHLLSRILVTWAELVVVGFLGAALGGAATGPPQLIVSLGTILASIAVVMYNVDRLVQTRIAEAP